MELWIPNKYKHISKKIMWSAPALGCCHSLNAEHVVQKDMTVRRSVCVYATTESESK